MKTRLLVAALPAALALAACTILVAPLDDIRLVVDPDAAPDVATAPVDAAIEASVDAGVDAQVDASCTLLTLQAALLPVGANAGGVAAGKLNADNLVDLVVTNRAPTSTVSVLVATGDAGFAAPVPFATSANPLSVAIADLDTDGKADLLTSGSNPPAAGILSSLMGNGNGTFAVNQDFPSTFGTAGLATGLVDNNAVIDAIVTNRVSNTATVFIGPGDGTFDPQFTLTTGPSPLGVAIGKIDGDVNADAVIVNTSANTVSVFRGNGDSTFQAKQDFATGNGATAVALGDLDKDGKLDVVTANGNGSTVSVLLGNGDGTLKAHVDLATGGSPLGLAVADLNGDGNLDIVVSSATANAVEVLLGKGDGTFAARQTFATSPGQSPTALLLADLNGDGKLDAFVVTSSDKGQVFLNTCP